MSVQKIVAFNGLLHVVRIQRAVLAVLYVVQLYSVLTSSMHTAHSAMQKENAGRNGAIKQEKITGDGHIFRWEGKIRRYHATTEAINIAYMLMVLYLSCFR